MIHNGVRIISDITAVCLFKETVLKEGSKERGSSRTADLVSFFCLKSGTAPAGGYTDRINKIL